MACILVATDGSEGANRAVDHAARLAQEDAIPLLVVNIAGGLQDQVFNLFTQPQQTWLTETLTALSAETLTKARERALAAGAATILLESRTGDIAQSILDIAEERQASLIVVGKRGAGRLAGLLIGSTSQKLVALAQRPVLVVP